MAVQRVLSLPELLAAIRKQLHPDDDFYSYDAGPGISCKHREDDTASAGLTALAVAACLSHQWFYVAVPILWQRLLEEALDQSAAPDAARRAFYTQHIRAVNITWCSPLWRGLLRVPGASSRGNRTKASAAVLQACL